MFNGIKEKVKEQQKVHEQKRIQKEKARIEAELQAAHDKRERIRIEQEKIQLEKDRLASLGEKELLAEAIMALRGFYVQFEKLREEQDEINERIGELEEDISSLRSAIESNNNN